MTLPQIKTPVAGTGVVTGFHLNSLRLVSHVSMVEPAKTGNCLEELEIYFYFPLLSERIRDEAVAVESFQKQKSFEIGRFQRIESLVCPRGESNSYTLRHHPLKMACLPIPPRGQKNLVRQK